MEYARFELDPGDKDPVRDIIDRIQLKIELDIYERPPRPLYEFTEDYDFDGAKVRFWSDDYGWVPGILERSPETGRFSVRYNADWRPAYDYDEGADRDPYRYSYAFFDSLTEAEWLTLPEDFDR